MKLLYIASIDFYTKPNPSYHLMTTMIEDVLNAGIEVQFIGCKEEGIEKHIPDSLLTRDGFKYDLIDVPKINKSHFVKRYFSGIEYSRKVGKKIHYLIQNCDVVFIQSSPTVVYTIWQVKKRVNKQHIIYNVQDMFPGSSIASGVMPNKAMQRIFCHLQKYAYEKSDCIVAISDDMKNKIIEQGVSEEKIKVIVNWFDDTSVREVSDDENRFTKKYKMSPDVFYVQYAGTMGYVFDYHMVISVAKKLEGYHDIVFQMIGEGSQKEEFMSEVNKEGIENIVFLPLEPQDMVSDVYSACDVCFIPLKRGIIGNSVPSKAGLLMACKRAIVTSVDKDTDYYQMINQHAGIAAPNDDVDAVTDAILTLYNDREKCNQLGRMGYQFGHITYSRSENTKKYIRLFMNEGK